MAGKKWAKHVHMKRGGLHGWCEHCPARVRHAALRTGAREDGAAVISKRLNYLANVANRENNFRLHEVARTDQRWVAANLEHKDLRRE
jgi:hypothetical protein